MLHYSPLLKKPCVRQVALDRRFPPESQLAGAAAELQQHAAGQRVEAQMRERGVQAIFNVI